MAFVAYMDGDRGATAALLLALADEQGINRRSIRTTRGGFFVPDELLVVDGVQVVSEPPVPLLAVPDEPKTPPPGWDDALPTPDVEFDQETGKVFLTTEAFLDELKYGTVVYAPEQSDADFSDEHVVDREVVRAWAKRNRLPVADRGALKRSVIDAYLAAHRG